MPSPPVLADYIDIKVGGQSLTEAVMNTMLDLEVESTYNRHDIGLISFNIEANTEIPPALEIGKALEITVKGHQETTGKKIFVGEVTALEFDALQQMSVFTVQAEDKFHRLFRGDRVRTFVNSTVSDAVKKIAQEAGLPAAIDATPSVLPFQMQQGVSDAVWLLERAAELGFHTRFKDGKLFFGKVGSGGDSGVTLEQGANLLSFSCRVTGSASMSEATVRSWDTMKKEAIVGRAITFTGLEAQPPASAKAFGSPKMVLPRTEFGNAGDAGKSAQAALDRSNEPRRQAEGRCFGDARIAVDKTIIVEGVNKRFNGKYRVSHLRHRYSSEEGFTTEFSCRGLADQSLPALVGESASASGAASHDRSPFQGAAVGIVTDNNDKDGWGRVKVKLPWLDDNETTDWLRVAFPGGGGSLHHGWYLIPEVNDEVLVVFEHGDPRRGYVLGGLHNGKDKPAYTNADVLESGKVNQRAFRLKNGTHLLFDEKAGQERIEIKNKDGAFIFKWHEKDGVVLENKTSGDKMAITNKGNMTIVCETGDISIEAKQGGITLKAMKDVKIDATGKVAVKATQDATIDGLNVKVNAQASAEVKGTATAKLEASGQTTVKGALVMIN